MGPEREDLRAALGAWATVAVAPSKRRRRPKVSEFLFDWDKGDRSDPDMDDDDDQDDQDDPDDPDDEGYTASYL